METNLTINPDAALTGWGTHYHLRTTGGLWSKEESKMHINCLELLAATLAVKLFAKDKYRAFILLRINNTIAVAYTREVQSPGI